MAADEAIHITRRQQLPATEAQALQVHAWVNLVRGNLGATEDFLRESSNLAKETNSTQVLVWSSFLEVGWLHHKGMEHAAIKAGEGLLAEATRLRFADTITLGHFVVGQANTALGNYERALSHLQQGYDFSREAEDTYFAPLFPNCIGYVFMMMGEREKSLEWNRLGLEVGLNTGQAEATINCLVNLGTEYLDRENYKEAQRWLDQARDSLDETEFFRWRHQTRLFYHYGLLELALGRGEQAMEWAEKVRELADATSAAKNLVRADKLVGEVYLADSQCQAAACHLQTALEGAQKLKNPNLTWEVQASLGRALVQLGERGEAAALYRDGLRLATDVAGRLQSEPFRKVLLASPPITALGQELERLK